MTRGCFWILLLRKRGRGGNGALHFAQPASVEGCSSPGLSSGILAGEDGSMARESRKPVRLFTSAGSLGPRFGQDFSRG